jgi:hypothetical protein
VQGHLRLKSAILIAFVAAVGILVPLDAKAGPIDFFHRLFHHNKKKIQQAHRRANRHLTQAGITVATPTASKKYKFQEHSAF